MCYSTSTIRNYLQFINVPLVWFFKICSFFGIAAGCGLRTFLYLFHKEIVYYALQTTVQSTCDYDRTGSSETGPLTQILRLATFPQARVTAEAARAPVFYSEISWDRHFKRDTNALFPTI
jgi:hypothetical protein